jgi:hypothetical protein
MGRFLLIVLLLAAIVFGVGIYLGWWSFAVHREQIHHDVTWGEKEAEKKGAQVKEGANAVANSKTATGKIRSVDDATDSFVLDTGKQPPLTLYTEPTTNMQITQLDDKKGAKATVVYEEKDGKNYATRITLAAK